MRISVFGNCQAAPIRSVLSQYTDIEAPHCPLNYQVSDTDSAHILSDFSKSDFIFAQRISNDFHVEWARTTNLAETFPGRVVVWPNVYFDGFYPDVRYLYYGSFGKVVGPISDYHFDSILNCFHKGKSDEQAAEIFSNDDILARYPNSIEASIAALKEREADCDITISDYLYNKLFDTAIQYTPNHPKSHVIMELTRRLCDRSGVPNRIDGQKALSELDFVSIPPYKAIANHYKLPEFDPRICGTEVLISDGKIKIGDQRVYNTIDMVAQYYEVYRTIFKI